MQTRKYNYIIRYMQYNHVFYLLPDLQNITQIQFSE